MSRITTLKPNQVCIFGSNSTGFHGAGMAGYACRGESRNTWRQDTWFLKALQSPIGSPDRIGKWAVLGVARGFQQGREGMSYAIQTIQKPGWKRSTPLSEIAMQLRELFVFAVTHPELEFLFTPIGAGLAGYTNAEMKGCLYSVLDDIGLPSNIKIPSDIYT